MQVYASIVKEAIQKNWRYPIFGTQKSITVTIEIKVAPDGRILSARVATPSGEPQLDNSALKAVRETEYLPPPPSRNIDTLLINFNPMELNG